MQVKKEEIFSRRFGVLAFLFHSTKVPIFGTRGVTAGLVNTWAGGAL